MARKTASKSNKTWTPDEPLKFDKAIQQNIPNSLVTDKLERADDALFPNVNKASRFIKPTNHKPFNRQKKG